MRWMVMRTNHGHKEIIIRDKHGVDMPADVPHRSLHHAIHAARHSFSALIAARGKWNLQKGTYYGYYLQWNHESLSVSATWFIVPIMEWKLEPSRPSLPSSRDRRAARIVFGLTPAAGWGHAERKS